jgi:hypothetical protein
VAVPACADMLLPNLYDGPQHPSDFVKIVGQALRLPHRSHGNPKAVGVATIPRKDSGLSGVS